MKVESCHADYNLVIEIGQRAFSELKALYGVSTGADTKVTFSQLEM